MYAPHGATVRAIRQGRVLAVRDFTGPSVDMPWWNDTKVVYVWDGDQIIAYGEVEPLVKAHDFIMTGDPIGYVLTVLREYKGRPMSMLHIEAYEEKMKDLIEDNNWNWITWTTRSGCPSGLLNPTRLLLSIPGTIAQWEDPYRS